MYPRAYISTIKMKRQRRGSVYQPRKRPRMAYPPQKLSPYERKQVKRIVNYNREKKHFASGNVALNISDVFTFYPLTDIPQGDTQSTRDGEQLKIVSGSVLGSIKGSGGENVIRIFVFRWSMNSTPTAADVFQIVSPSIGSFYSPINQRNKQFIHVIHDRMHTLSGTGQGSKIISVKIPSQPKITYNTSAVTGANKIYMVTISDDAATPFPILAYRSEIIYTDS